MKYCTYYQLKYHNITQKSYIMHYFAIGEINIIYIIDFIPLLNINIIKLL